MKDTYTSPYNNTPAEASATNSSSTTANAITRALTMGADIIRQKMEEGGLFAAQAWIMSKEAKELIETIRTVHGVGEDSGVTKDIGAAKDTGTTEGIAGSTASTLPNDPTTRGSSSDSSDPGSSTDPTNTTTDSPSTFETLANSMAETESEKNQQATQGEPNVNDTTMDSGTLVAGPAAGSGNWKEFLGAPAEKSNTSAPAITPGKLPIIFPNARVKRVDLPKNGEPEDKRIRATYDAVKKLPMQDQLKKLSAMPMTDRLIAAHIIDSDAFQANPDDQRRLLALCGVSPEVIAGAFDPRTSLETYRQSLTVSMLPKELQAPTQAWIDSSTAWAAKNKETLANWDAHWRTAQSNDNKKVLLQEMKDRLGKDLGLPPLPAFEWTDDSPNPFHTATGERDKRVKIFVNLNHEAFLPGKAKEGQSEKLNGDNFSGAISVLLHEIMHTQQIPHLEEAFSKYERYFIANPLTINTVSPIVFGALKNNNKPYVAQPVEMQPT